MAVFCVVQWVVLVSYSSLGDLAVEADFLAEIAPAAQNLAAGELHVADYPFKGPVSAMAVALLGSLTWSWGLGLFRTGNLMSIMAAAAALWCVYRIGFVLWGRRTAVAAVLLTAVNNVFFINAHKAGSDLLFLALVMGVLYLALVGTPGRRRWLVIGALSGVVFLTRYIGIVLPVWLVAWILILRPAGFTRRDSLMAAAWTMLGFATVTAPWLILNLVESGALLVTKNLQNVILDFYPNDPPAAGLDSLAGLVAHDPIYFLTHYLGNLGRHVIDDVDQVLNWAMALLTGLGLAVVFRAPRDRRHLALLAWALVYLAAFGFVFYLARFSLPLVPVYALLAASLLDRLPRWPVLAVIVLVGFSIIGHIGFYPVAIDFYRSEQPDYLHGSIGRLARESSDWPGSGKPRLMARKPHAAWYGQMEYVPFPGRLSGVADLLAFADRNDADFLMVGLLEHRFFPECKYLDQLETYVGVKKIFQSNGNTVYRLDRKKAGTDFGTNTEIVRLQRLWEAAVAANDTSAVNNTSVRLFKALDRDGRLAEAREVAVGKLGFANEREELIVRLYIGITSLRMGDTTTGISALEGHLARDGRLELNSPVAKGCLLLGWLYIEAGDASTALEWLHRAEDLYRKMGLHEDADSARKAIDKLT